MLNAFRHHRVLRIDTGALSSVPVGAQRLSASQGATPETCPSPSWLPCKVLNAFRHHRVLRMLVTGDTFYPGECSTPFGITGCYARTVSIDGNPTHLCSTPFGITGCYAVCGRLSPRAISSAQRLSASQGATLAQAEAHYANVEECSTPFGITGCYAPLPPVSCRQLDPVLNAFRHHRVLRKVPLVAPLLIIRVLNAFRHHRVLRG